MKHQVLNMWQHHANKTSFSTPSLAWWPGALVAHGQPRQWMPFGTLAAHGFPHWVQLWMVHTFQSHTQLALHATQLMAMCGPAMWSCHAIHLQVQKNTW